MSQSLSAVYVHMVFSTKNRHEFLHSKELRDRLHAYVGGIAKGIGCAPMAVGGTADHIHILVRQSRTASISETIKSLKISSNLWIKREAGGPSHFDWQDGYGAFSVGTSQLDSVCEYIRNQEAHHRTISFQDEFRKILEEHEIEWNEQFVWG